jgi:ATP-binding protein involved in chromosome partitioning
VDLADGARAPEEGRRGICDRRPEALMSQVTEAQVLDALRPIIDPDFGRSIVDLGFVRDVAIEGGRVAFKIVLTTPACPVKAEFERAARERVAALPGVSDVRVEMGADTRGRGGAAARPAQAGDVLPGVRNTLAVASGKGGVGKSNTAVNLALALAATGARVGLLDADVYGPSLPTLLGTSERPGTEERGERKVILPVERHGLKLMSMGFFITESSPVIWRGPMVHGLIRQFQRFGHVFKLSTQCESHNTKKSKQWEIFLIDF